MILRIDERLFQDPAAARPLTHLLRRLEEREDAVLPWPEDRSVESGSPIGAWIAARPDDHDRDVFQAMFDLGPIIEASIPERPNVAGRHQPQRWRRSGPLDVRVIPGDVSDWRRLQLSIRDTAHLIAEPIHLFFENDVNDYAFLRLLCPATQRSELDRLRSSPARLQPRGGGTGMLQQHFRKLAESESLSDEELRRLWRTWVLFDRDASTTDALMASGTITTLIANIEQIHQKYGVPVTWICLQRREIESYVPDDGLRDLRPRHKHTFVDPIVEWRRGGARQAWAWAFDMKKGLLGDLSVTVERERRQELKAGSDLKVQDLKTPFDALGAPDRRRLRCGFGDGWFIKQLSQKPRRPWIEEIGTEYDRGPIDQIPRAALVQSIFDRI